MHSNIVALQNMFHILHIYKLNMKNVSISLSTITYKRHINIVVYTQYDDLCAVPVSVKCFYLIKLLFLHRKCIMLKVSYTWTYLMPHLHKQLMFISLVTSMVWGTGPKEWDPIMTVLDVWIPDRYPNGILPHQPNQCQNVHTRLYTKVQITVSSFWDNYVLVISEALWHVTITNAILKVWIFIQIWWDFFEKRKAHHKAHRKTQTYIHAVGGIQTYNHSNPAYKTVHNLCSQWLPNGNPPI